MKNRTGVVNRIEAPRMVKNNKKVADRFCLGFGVQSLIIGITSVMGLQWGAELIIIGLTSLVIYYWRNILKLFSI